MGWDGPILTDSGGFQVFSLRDTLLAVDDDGVTFRSVYDGAPARFTPELAARDPAQPRLGRRHVPRHLPAGRRPARRARGGRAPHDALGGAPARGASARPGQLLFGITQGAADPELRRRSIEEITALDFDGYALGGLAVGESREEMFDAIGWAAPLLPADAAALLHGHRRRRGDPRA